MPSVRIFGLQCPIAGTAVNLPNLPNVTGTWKGTFDSAALKLHLECRLLLSAIHTVDILADIALQADAQHAGDYCPKDGPNAQSGSAHVLVFEVSAPPPSAASLWLAVSALRQQSATISSQTLSGKGGQLLITFPVINVVVGADLPIGVLVTHGFYLDLSKQSVRFENDALVLAHNATLDVGPRRFAALQRQLRSNALDIDLSISVGVLLFEFESRSRQSLPLYVDYFDPPNSPSSPDPKNPLVSAISFTDYLVHARIGLVGNIPTLHALSVAGPELKLRASAYSNGHNQPLMLGLNQEIPLHIRPGTIGRPSTLLIANQFPVSSPLPTTPTLGRFHSRVESVQFECNGSSLLVCSEREPYSNAMPAGIDPAVVSEMTYPSLSFSGDSNTVYVSKAGDAYLATPTVNNDVETLATTGSSVTVPLISPSVFRNSGPARGHAWVQGIDSTLQALQYVVGNSSHETLVGESGLGPSVSTVHIDKMFGALADNQTIRLKEYKIHLDYGPIGVDATVSDVREPSYYVISQASDLSGNFKFKLDPEHASFALSGVPEGRSGVFAIVKLSRSITLSDIFHELKTQIGFDDASVPDFPEMNFSRDVIDQSLNQPTWTGLIMFGLPLAPEQQLPVLQTLLDGLISGTHPIRLSYLSISPQRAGDFSVAGRVLWKRVGPPQSPVGTDDKETRYQVTQLDVSWADHTLQKFFLDSKLYFDRFFGMLPSAPKGPLEIIGSYDRLRGELRFLGQFNQPLALLPDDNNFGPLKQLWLKTAEIRFVNNQTSVDMSGSVDLRNLTFGGRDWFQLPNPNLSIDFQNLRIGLDGWEKFPLSINYPSLQFVFDLPPFNFGFIGVQLNSIALDWNNSFDWGGLLPLVGWNLPPMGVRVALGFRLELMKMPELSLPGLDRLVLNIVTIFGQDASTGRWSPGHFAIGIRAFAFDHLDIDLMRFLEISADKVAFTTGDVPDSHGATSKVSWLQLLNVKVKIVGTTILSDVSFLLFSSQDVGVGFVCVYAPSQPLSLSFMRIRWALIANNISLPGDLPQRLITAQPAGDAQDNQINKDLNDVLSHNKFLAGSPVNAGGWIFAAGFSVVGLFDAKFLFQDHAYYGISIGGGIFHDWFGYDFGISVLYIKGSTPDQDAFVVSVRVPFIAIGDVAFTGGVITIEIVMNGGFTLDIGFPVLQADGGRDWSRALGAIVTPFQGSGGFYIRKHQLSVGGDKIAQLSGGYAVQCGLGASFGGDILTVWATIGLYFILEGDVYLDLTNPNDRLRALRLVGAVGVLVRAGGELNWWVISIRIDVTLSAEARATLSYGDLQQFADLPTPRALSAAAKEFGSHDPERHVYSVATVSPSFLAPQTDRSLVSSTEVTLQVDLTVYASAHAEACIGGGWFRICAGIDVTIPIHCQYTIYLHR